MAEKTSFQSLLHYGFEIILANISLLAFSALVGGGLTIWLGELVPQTGLIGAASGFIFFTCLTYTLLVPALLYKLIADGVAKGLELDNSGEHGSRNVEYEDIESDSGLDPDKVELQDHHSDRNMYGDSSENSSAEELENQRITPLYVLGLLVGLVIVVQILLNV